MNVELIAKLLDAPALPVYMRRVEEALHQLPEDISPTLRDPIKRILGANGKRLRPILLVSVVASQGKEIDEAVTAFKAIFKK